MDYCTDVLSIRFQPIEYDTKTCIDFLERLIEANRQSVDERPLEERQTTQKSIRILEAIQDKLQQLQACENAD